MTIMNSSILIYLTILRVSYNRTPHIIRYRQQGSISTTEITPLNMDPDHSYNIPKKIKYLSPGIELCRGIHIPNLNIPWRGCKGSSRHRNALLLFGAPFRRSHCCYIFLHTCAMDMGLRVGLSFWMARKVIFRHSGMVYCL